MTFSANVLGALRKTKRTQSKQTRTRTDGTAPGPSGFLWGGPDPSRVTSHPKPGAPGRCAGGSEPTSWRPGSQLRDWRLCRDPAGLAQGRLGAALLALGWGAVSPVLCCPHAIHPVLGLTPGPHGALGPSHADGHVPTPPQSPFKGIQTRKRPSLHWENRTVSCSSERVGGGVPSEAGPLGRRAGWERRHLACNTALGALLWVGYLFLADFMQRRSIMNSIAFCVRAI